MPHSHGGNKCSARGGGSVSHFLAPQQGRSDPANPVQLAQIAWSALAPAVLLTALGWWGIAGFTRRSTWRSLVPFLPLILILAVPPIMQLVFEPRDASHTPGYFTLVAVSALAAGFGTEATLRGVVLQTLLPRGRLRAVMFSSVLFGAVFIAPLAARQDPVILGVQALATVGIGVAFAALVVVTGTIWPLVVISAAMSIPVGIQNDFPAALDSGVLVGSLTVGALAAAYGIWLLHRDQYRHAAHSGEDDQFSPPQEPSAA